MEMTAQRWRLKIEELLPRRADLSNTAGKLLISTSLWRALRRDARHPIAAHFGRQLKAGQRVNVLALGIGYGLLLTVFFAYSYSIVDHAIVWTLPLWLMLFSLSYCAIWIGRIVALMSRQARAGVLDEVSLIPPGQTYVYLVIGKMVLNQGDALAWLTLLRRYVAGLVLFSLLMALCIASTQIGQVNPLDLAALLVALAFVTLAIPLEHKQSAIIACLTAIIFCTRATGQIDKASAAVVGFALLQILSYALAIAIVVVLEAGELSLALALYLLIRELLILGLWRAVLGQANEEDILQPST